MALAKFFAKTGSYRKYTDRTKREFKLKRLAKI